MNDFLEIAKSNVDLFEDLNLRHSKFQLENFVLGQEQGSTIWGQYKQALRELNQRINSLNTTQYKIKKRELAIKKLDRSLAQCQDDIELEELELDIEQEKRKLENLFREEKEIIHEGNILTDAFLRLKKDVDCLLAAGKSKEELEKEFWIEKLKADVQNSVLSTSGASMTLLRAIRGMNDEEASREI
ncbi:MAG: hypothetical protein OEZ36_03755, partial [Spirochaetota bacterium]|nr:hypothetical protein [Spirochaetota bacterium]